MAANEIHLNDIGTVFEVTILDGSSAVDISAATTKQIIFKKKDRTILTAAGTFVTDGTDGKIKYTAVSGDLSVVGEWSIQAYIVTPSGEWRSDISTFTVHSNLT